MSPRSKSIRFPKGKCTVGVILDEEDHELLAGAIGPCHGGDIEDSLAATPAVDGRRFLCTDTPIIDDVLAALGVEVNRYMKLDRERDVIVRAVPKRGSTTERLLVLYGESGCHNWELGFRRRALVAGCRRQDAGAAAAGECHP